MSPEEDGFRMIDTLASATCRLECATRALNTYLTLRTAATSSDPEYQRLLHERVTAEQTYRTNLVAVLADRDERTGSSATDSVAVAR
jgi:hypothetical protein